MYAFQKKTSSYEISWLRNSFFQFLLTSIRAGYQAATDTDKNKGVRKNGNGKNLAAE